jgi:hypothetical protein
VYALVSIHQLRDAEIHTHARQHVSFVAAQMLLAHQKFDRLANRDPGRLGQIFMEAHADVIPRRLGARPLQVHVFADYELERSGELRLHRRNVHLAISLPRVSVADLE